MALFSERYGYKKPQAVFLRECMPKEVENVLCSAYDYLKDWLNHDDVYARRSREESYGDFEEYVWVRILKEKICELRHYRGLVISNYLTSCAIWYEKLDLVELTIKKLRDVYGEDDRAYYIEKFVDFINASFKDIGYAYRIVGNEIVEITNNEEIIEIENAISSTAAVAVHISAALEHISQRPTPDYRNSIKESISAVEYVCRDLTGESTLGDALKEIKKRGIEIPAMLVAAFEKLYAYTNAETTGIRHALMDDVNEPGFEEAKFMLVVCSAFVNYMLAKNN